MKNFLIVAFLMLLNLNVMSQDNRSALMPMPNEISDGKGRVFGMDEKISISYCSEGLLFAAENLQKAIQSRMGMKLALSESGKSKIRLEIDDSFQDKEQYSVDIDNKGIVIKGKTKGAVLYGVITLDQIMMGDVVMTHNKQIREIHIDDKPRFGYRAMMLDPARHFLPVESVKFFIEKMAQFKYNVLQLHLTDDQGWRIYIDEYPGLASKEHYTKDDLKEIIEFAEKYNVEVIPEIDIPGHTSAILSVFPEFKCSHMDTVSIEVGKTVNMMLCASVDKVYSVIDNVIKEVAEVFPSEYIHLGGDEAVVEANWGKCPECKELMKKSGYDSPSQLMIPFFDNVFASVKKHGKKTILWCELDNIYMPANEYLFPYPKDVTLVSWRAGLTPKCMELTRLHGNDIVMAPGEYAYFDYPQYKGDFPEFDNWGMPMTTLETCYKFDPGYGKAKQEQAHVRGVMATLWGEAIRGINRATYMAFPRGFALAEAGWTEMENRNWESFKTRIYPNIINMAKQGVSVRIPFEIEQNLEQYK